MVAMSAPKLMEAATSHLLSALGRATTG